MILSNHMHTEDIDRLYDTFDSAGPNPYLFTSSKAVQHNRKGKKRARRLPHEEEVLREQRRIFFDSDTSVRRLFNNDFEEYSDALDNPELLIARIENSVRAGMAPLGRFRTLFPIDGATVPLSEEFGRIEEIEDTGIAGEALEGASEDALYQKAHTWAHALFDVSMNMYRTSEHKKKEVYAIIANVFLIPAKIAFSSSSAVYDDIEDALQAEMDLQGYTLAMIFLKRVQASLELLQERTKGFAVGLKRAKKEAREIEHALNERMLALVKAVR